MFSVPQDRPVYRILSPNGFFGPNDHLFKEGEVVAFDGEPNEDMEPLNKMAQQNLEAYLNKLDDLARAAAKKNNRQFSGRPRSLDGVIQIASQDARRTSLTPGDGGVPLMSGTKVDTGIEKIEMTEIPQTGGKASNNSKGIVSLSKTANNATPII